MWFSVVCTLIDNDTCHQRSKCCVLTRRCQSYCEISSNCGKNRLLPGLHGQLIYKEYAYIIEAYVLVGNICIRISTLLSLIATYVNTDIILTRTL